MGYAILRHGKIKGSSKGVCAAHNRRLANEPKENIDVSLAQLNEYSGDAKIVDRINAKLPEKRRKDAVEAVEILLTASPEFFDGLETDRKKLASHPTFLKWKAATAAWAKKELGGNLVDLSLHMDERSPHVHAVFVPLIEGRLCAKEVTSRVEMVRRQTSYAQSMAAFGLVRGDPAAETHRKHVGLKEKPSAAGGQLAKDQAAEIQRLQAEIERLTQKGSDSDSRLAEAQEKLSKLQRKSDRQQALNIDNMHVINGLTQEKTAMAEVLKTATARDHELVAEITAQRQMNANAQASLEQLRAINAVLVDQARERLAKGQEAPWGALSAPPGVAPDREPIQTPKIDPEAAKAALLAEFKPGRVATKGEAAEGRVVGWVDGLAILHMGRGVHVRTPLPPGAKPVVGQTLKGHDRGQEKSGIG